MFCKYCGKENLNDAKFCNSCGRSLTGDAAPVNIPPTAPQSAAPNSNLAIASLVFGICSIPTAFLALWISLLCAIAAIVTGKISLKQKRPGKDYAVWGLRLGGIGLGIFALILVLYVISVIGIFGAVSDSFSDFPSINR